MSGKAWTGVALALAVTAGARAEDGQAQAGSAGASTSPAFEQACIDLLHGRVPAGGEQSISALRKACDSLMDARTAERAQAEERARAQRELAASQQQAAQQQGSSGTGAGGAQAQAGRGTAQPAQGASIAAAFEQAGRELVGPQRGQAMGMRSGGPVRFTLVSDPVGWFTGVGVNATLFGSLMPKLSWVGGARYSTTDATNGNVTTFGLMGGADYFITGRNNEGFRIGPRVELAVGRESIQGNSTFAWMGLSGEAGYNFVATNGISGLLALGLGGRVAGDERQNFASFTGGEFGPYLRLGVGYSW